MQRTSWRITEVHCRDGFVEFLDVHFSKGLRFLRLVVIVCWPDTVSSGTMWALVWRASPEPVNCMILPWPCGQTEWWQVWGKSGSRGSVDGTHITAACLEERAKPWGRWGSSLSASAKLSGYRWNTATPPDPSPSITPHKSRYTTHLVVVSECFGYVCDCLCESLHSHESGDQTVGVYILHFHYISLDYVMLVQRTWDD